MRHSLSRFGRIAPGMKSRVAVKVANEWFIAHNCGSNYYLGYGPTGILKLREACANKNIAGFL
ncbi:MAG: hypothetical protein NT144_14250 [Bacteroidia bacterium]|nr:hypothetical protein [Bacteroidia bacterium]